MNVPVPLRPVNPVCWYSLTAGRGSRGHASAELTVVADLTPEIGAAMKVSKQHVADLLRKAGYAEVADEAIRDLPDPVELDHAAAILQRYGITKDAMISHIGGSP
jgi:hypothetical protein